MNSRKFHQKDQVELLRGGSVISSFAGAFGGALRETRLTAMLGYLIALKPKVFCDEFGIRGTVESVCLEARHNLDRSDIGRCGGSRLAGNRRGPGQELLKYAFLKSRPIFWGSIMGICWGFQTNAAEGMRKAKPKQSHLVLADGHWEAKRMEGRLRQKLRRAKMEDCYQGDIGDARSLRTAIGGPVARYRLQVAGVLAGGVRRAVARCRGWGAKGF